MVLIVDYGMGNLGSILNMLKKVGAEARISSDQNEIASENKLILPGVGSYDKGMQALKERGLVEILKRKVLIEKSQILGICLGAQLLTKGSEEGDVPGLGWIDAVTVRFRPLAGDCELRIPHMGWNEISITRTNPLLAGFEEQPRFYFVHSYYIKCANSADVIATSTYGTEFAAAINRGNIWGTQFHPEKSHKFGMSVIKNFCDLSMIG